MDRIPRLRRKPKPPAIETSIDRPSKSTIDVVADGHLHSPTTPRRQYASSMARKTSSPFRRPRPAVTKRARPPSPPSEQPPSTCLEQPSTSPSTTRVAMKMLLGQDGLAPHGLVSHPCLDFAQADVNGHLSPRLEVPGFLVLSNQEMDRKFQEITWTERLRLADAHKNRVVQDYKWGHHQLSEALTASGMDRYSNIKPWNWNRVRLRVPHDQLDYVNASSITLHSLSDESLPPLRYIAMQGPTEVSFGHVWRMVAEQQSSPAVIVQLTTMVEGGMLKCHQYFPHGQAGASWSLNEEDIWDDGWAAQLTLDSVQECADGAIEISKLLLRIKGESKVRTVWHLLYRQWPDFGVPALQDLAGFFQLMQLSQEYSAPTSPRIVHCSAGVGRTGTFICLEYLARELRVGAFAQYGASESTPDAIFDTVERLRQQRRGMVQAEIQFRFIYTVMRLLWCQMYGVSDDSCHAQPASTQPATAKKPEVADPFADESSHSHPPARVATRPPTSR